MNQTVESLYHLVPPGWRPLLDKYLPQIWALVPDAELLPVASSRVLFIGVFNIKNNAPFADITAITDAATQESATVCKLCGEPGYLHTDGTRKETLCDRCAALRQSEKAVSEDVITDPNPVEQACTEDFVEIPAERLAEAAELLRKKDAGLLLELPGPVGTPVWLIVTRRFRRTGSQFSFIRPSKLQWSNMDRCINELGKTVFLTEEDAEEALAAIQKEGASNGS